MLSKTKYSTPIYKLVVRENGGRVRKQFLIPLAHPLEKM